MEKYKWRYIQEMPQSRSLSFLRHQKKDRWGINNDKQGTQKNKRKKDAFWNHRRTNKEKNCNKGTALERLVKKKKKKKKKKNY